MKGCDGTLLSQFEMLEGAKSMGAGAATIASAGAAVGIGNVFSSLIHSVARNPSLAKQLFGYAILGFALTEAIALFALMMAFLILFGASLELNHPGCLFSEDDSFASSFPSSSSDGFAPSFSKSSSLVRRVLPKAISSLCLWRPFQVVHSLRYGFKVIPHAGAGSPACALSLWSRPGTPYVFRY
ncbi:hypothetical protein VNO78_36389 [Psophocarpus tetragonolobus]|uniref:ATP synthase subunit 9, mitochondrial n=1 Tax=Psophocarpus tetragonolobus TaxID=3891 RepID=A0AAN9NEU4_PSOTE